MFLNSIQNLIDEKEVISFDIFDTLLLRPYICPADLFYHLGLLTKNSEFAKARILAEQKAWLECVDGEKEDVTFDEIYNNLSPEFSAYKEREVEFETRMLTPNPEMLEVYNYALRTGKKVILVSDMYLPYSVLEKILHQKGICGYFKLFVSSDSHKRKHTKNLYLLAQREINVPFHSILHIGDNYQSDYQMATEAGLSAVFYEKVQDKFFREHPASSSFWDKNQDVAASFLLGSLILGWHLYNCENPQLTYWHKMGYLYGGPLCYGYMKMLEKSAKINEIKDVFFVARDGYSLKRIFDSFGNKDINTTYVYAPRFTNLLCRLDFGKRPHIISERQDILLKYLKEEELLISDEEDSIIENKAQLIQENMDKLKAISERAMSEYKAYLLSSELNGSNIGVVDTISMSFSAQQLITAVLPEKNVRGYYWAAYVNEENNYLGNEFERYCESHGDLNFAHFVEFLMAAPEKPIHTIQNGKPVYRESISFFEQKKIDIYPFISEAEVAYAHNLNSFLQGIGEIPYSSETIVAWVNALMDCPTEEDRENMSAIKNAIDVEHSIYENIFPDWHQTVTEKKIKAFGLTVFNKKTNPSKISIKALGLPLFYIKVKARDKYIKYIVFLFCFVRVFSWRRKK